MRIGWLYRDGVSVTDAAVLAQRFGRYFSNVRASHYYGNAGGADCVCHAIGARNHSGHCADAHQSDFFFLNKLDQLLFVHWPSVAVNQKYFMLCRRQRLQQEHPEMRHEVVSHAIIRVIQ